MVIANLCNPTKNRHKTKDRLLWLATPGGCNIHLKRCQQKQTWFEETATGKFLMAIFLARQFYRKLLWFAKDNNRDARIKSTSFGRNFDAYIAAINNSFRK